MKFGVAYKALGSEVAKSRVTEDDLGGIEEVKRTTKMASKKEGLRLHVNIRRVLSESGDFVGEEDGGGVEMLAHTVPYYTSELLDFFLPHSQGFC